MRNHAKMVDCYLTTFLNNKGMFGDKKKQGNHHETSFVKQLGYCLIMIILNLW